MQGRREQALAAFAPLLRGGREEVGEAELPESVEESVLGGLYWLAYNAILAAQPEPIEELRAELVEFALLPFLGAAAARSAAAR
jgi:hypothetical protein